MYQATHARRSVCHYHDFAYATRRSDGGTVIGMFESTPTGVQYRGSWLDAANVPFDTSTFIPADQVASLLGRLAADG